MAGSASRFGLVCSGGGTIGAFQVGVLKYVHENFSKGNRTPFKVFAGISCGSLNSTYLAIHSSEPGARFSLLEKLWGEFHVPAYFESAGALRRSLLRHLLAKKQAKGSFWSMLDPEPMNAIIRKGFDREALDRSLKAGSTRGLSVATTDLATGRPVWFVEGSSAVEWKRFHSLGVRTRLEPAHVAASCSFPFFLPPVGIGERYYSDGSLNLERPFSAAISMGATKILGIATRPDAEMPLGSLPASFSPSFSTLVRSVVQMFSRNFMVSEKMQLDTLNRGYRIMNDAFNGGSGQTDPVVNALFDPSFDVRKYQPVEVALIQPSVSIPESVEKFAKSQGKSARSYPSANFLFHRDFIGRWIEQGYADAKTNHHALKSFFSSLAGVAPVRKPASVQASTSKR